MSTNMCNPFDPELEEIAEFFQRFRCQMSEVLHKHRNDQSRQASVLLKLPVSIITDLQRRLAPALLTDATFDEIEEQLLQQFSKTKSTIGASVQFLNCKQQQGQSLEEYARKLNSLASLCKYPKGCLDRLLRDIFVAGLASSAILSSLIQVCDNLSFNETLETAKLLESFRKDAENIRSARTQTVHAVSDSNRSAPYDDVNKVTRPFKTPNSNYLCYRCGVRGHHFSDDCSAKHKTCLNCNKQGHI